jgi:CHAT domain-containing protein/tetratricopeptide (TPR) repeat protein
MSQDAHDEEHLRQYLLGELNEAEQQVLEGRLMAESTLFDLLPVAEDELVDDYLGGALSASEHAKFESFFISTPERRRKVSFAMALRRYVTAEGGEAAAAETAAAKPAPRISGTASSVVTPHVKWWNRAYSGSYLRMAAAAVILLAIGVGSWRTYLYFRQPHISKGIAALREAYREQRPTEARITGFNYAPPPPTTRGPERDKFDYVALDRAKALIQLEANEHPNSKSYHDLGRLYLAQGEYNKAIDQFEKAAKLDAKNAQLQSDLGAVRLELGKEYESVGEKGRGLEQYSKSIEHLNRAIELDDRLLEALFNRALCHEYMLLPLEQSKRDWSFYLDKDSSSRWADEARRRLQALENRDSRIGRTKEQLHQQFFNAYRAGDSVAAWEALSKSRARVGNSTIERLVDQYLQIPPATSNAESKDYLAALSYAGELELENAGDRFTLDLAQFYKQLEPSQRPALRAARELTMTAHTQIERSEFKAASETYGQAKRTFDEIGNKTESRSADYWLAICRVQQANPEKTPAIFEQILEASEKDGYKWIKVRASNALANYSLIHNEYSRAISYSSHSRDVAMQTQDAYGLVIALADLIKAYSLLGDHRQTLDCLQQLLQLSAQTPLEPIQRCLCFARTAWTLYSEGLLGASLDYQRSALESALKLNELTMICTAYVHLGMLYANLNDLDKASVSVGRALEIATARSAERPASLMIAYSTLHLGSLNRQAEDFPAAIANYNRSIEIYTELNHPVLIHQGHKGLVLSYVAMGDTASAAEELAKAIRYYEDHRSKIWDAANRNTFFDLQNDIYDIAIDFEYSRMSSPRAAFDYAELSRARSLRDQIHRDAHAVREAAGPSPLPVTEPLGFEQIQEKLPKQAQVVQYAVLDDKLIVWFFTKTSALESWAQPIDSKSLSELVGSYSSLVSSPGSDPRELSRLSADLHRLLIGPFENKLDKNAQLFIVPDKFLNNVPFQALRSSSSDRYLIQDYAVLLAPSSNVLIDCTDEAGKKQTNRETALCVGVTHFKQDQYGKFPNLPSADREAREVASNYLSSVCLSRGQASKGAVLREMPRANVIHIASHFVSSDSSPMRSRLLLAEDPSEDSREKATNGALEVSEIFRAKLPLTRLAVLSACQTGNERYYRGEGAMSLAHAFIAAGVPLVLASAWSVDSEATTELMSSFHRMRKHGAASSAEALRRAQVAMLSGTDSRQQHPYYWASFNLIGGFAEY